MSAVSGPIDRTDLAQFRASDEGAFERIVHGLIPGAANGWTAAGVDEFLRAYLTPAGRAAFYAAARQMGSATSATYSMGPKSRFGTRPAACNCCPMACFPGSDATMT